MSIDKKGMIRLSLELIKDARNLEAEGKEQEAANVRLLITSILKLVDALEERV